MAQNPEQLIEKLAANQYLSLNEWQQLLAAEKSIDKSALFDRALQVRHRYYDNHIYLRGLIEISNYCHNDCYYCGIRLSNRQVKRYRLDKDTILACCNRGYQLGLRTFVLQGGEDNYYNDALMVEIIRAIKNNFPDCALTLSLGEKPAQSYQAYFEAGADRYLLRHETADSDHYQSLHPANLNLKNRLSCLQNLKQIGFQVGCGFMVGSPGQTIETLAQDFMFLSKFKPQMVGIGPFLPHHQTPLAKAKGGSAEQTIFCLSLVRLLLPRVLLPATTALGTVDNNGWELGIKAGANVIMPNLTPADQRKHYLLYDNKNATSAEESDIIKAKMAAIGYQVVNQRGDYNYPKEN